MPQNWGCDGLIIQVSKCWTNLEFTAAILELRVKISQNQYLDNKVDRKDTGSAVTRLGLISGVGDNRKNMLTTYSVLLTSA